MQIVAVHTLVVGKGITVAPGSLVEIRDEAEALSLIQRGAARLAPPAEVVEAEEQPVRQRAQQPPPRPVPAPRAPQSPAAGKSDAVGPGAPPAQGQLPSQPGDPGEEGR